MIKRHVLVLRGLPGSGKTLHPTESVDELIARLP